MELLAKPKVDEIIPPYLALNKYLAQFDDFATQVNQADTDDTHGLSHILYSAADFLALKGTARIIPQDPGDYTADMVGALLELHKERKATFKRYKVGASFVGNAFVIILLRLLVIKCIQRCHQYRIKQLLTTHFQISLQ